ncbi:uncharacterized protein BDZ99DRAFT_386586 [Mytilinidion resinicola]|uniref:Increased loss of mitochondrial DNA protein 1 n=1 Tax=Mytilinidion resinicola TaxID=574789 RepID=A0A6A6YLZ3_9PEZI|nr:uncharacterized protein BDZ99DRAFT_386586 [Mytilinidion resinicola]KAF2809896.1 hypothetical protein BDZ99DRAFT_386586 [Mytilinidion resinicola]
MALFSAFTLIRCIALFHITLAYFFLVSPKTLADQNVVFLLGESMRLDIPPGFAVPTAATAFLAIILALFGISDLAAVSLPDEYARIYWGTQVPVRLLFLFGITGYTYMFKEGGVLAPKNYRGGVGDHLKNAMVFTWGFVELSVWFWVFISLRDERRQKGMELIEKRKREAENYSS